MHYKCRNVFNKNFIATGLCHIIPIITLNSLKNKTKYPGPGKQRLGRKIYEKE